MTRGFYTGLAAALAFFALSGLWLLSAAQSDRDVSELTSLDALQLSEYAADAQRYLSSAVADAEHDAAFATHGCIAQGGFCQQARDRIVNYTNQSAAASVGFGFSSRTFLHVFSCIAQAPPMGFSHAYVVNASLNFTLTRGPVRVVRWVNQSDLVLVNASAAFRSVVNRSGPAGLWEVSVNC